MKFDPLICMLDTLVLHSKLGKKLRPMLSGWRATGGCDMSIDRVRRGVERPQRRTRSVAAMSAFIE